MSEMYLGDRLAEPITGDLALPPAPDFCGVALQGSMQQILSQNLGKYVVCEFLVGSEEKETKAGILYFVGASYLVLYDDTALSFVVCDAYPLKFVTFLATGREEPDVMPVPVVRMEDGQPIRQQPSQVQQQSQAQQQSNPLSSAPPPTGIRAGGGNTQAKAAFNYTKRKSLTRNCPG